MSRGRSRSISRGPDEWLDAAAYGVYHGVNAGRRRIREFGEGAYDLWDGAYGGMRRGGERIRNFGHSVMNGAYALSDPYHPYHPNYHRRRGRSRSRSIGIQYGRARSLSRRRSLSWGRGFSPSRNLVRTRSLSRARSMSRDRLYGNGAYGDYGRGWMGRRFRDDMGMRRRFRGSMGADMRFQDDMDLGMRPHWAMEPWRGGQSESEQTWQESQGIVSHNFGNYTNGRRQFTSSGGIDPDYFQRLHFYNSQHLNEPYSDALTAPLGRFRNGQMSMGYGGIGDDSMMRGLGSGEGETIIKYVGIEREKGRMEFRLLRSRDLMREAYVSEDGMDLATVSYFPGMRATNGIGGAAYNIMIQPGTNLVLLIGAVVARLWIATSVDRRAQGRGW